MKKINEEPVMNKQKILSRFSWVLVILAVCLCYMCSRATGLYQHHMRIRGIMLTGLACCCLYIVIRKPNEQKICALIIVMGMIMRIGYMLYTGCNERQHDMGVIAQDGSGHAAYLLTLIKEGHLPDVNNGQMYQQPLFYILGAGISKLINGILRSGEDYFLVDAVKTVSCSASCIILLISRKIGTMCRLDKKGLRYALTVIAFLPAFYHTAGMVSPDALTGMFMLLAFMLTLQWMENSSWKNTVLLAFTYGFAIMTKISCGVIALITAVLFIWKFISEIKNKKKIWLSLMVKYAVFGMIALPLGLLYSVRNYVMFGQSLSYVLPIGVDSWLYRGDHTIAERYFLVPLADFFKSPYVDLQVDYNAPAYYIKSAFFNEFQYPVPEWLPEVLLICGLVCALASITAWIWYMVKCKKKDFNSNVIAFSCVWYYVFMWYFYLKYPHVCSMDFRYMLFLVIPFAILLGKYIQFHDKAAGWIKTGIYGLAVFSCGMYICWI